MKFEKTADDINFIEFSLKRFTQFQEFLRDMNQEEKLQIYQSLGVEEFPTHSILFQKGNRCERLFLILTGFIDVQNYQKTSVATLGTGKIVGQIELMRGRPWIHTGIAQQQTLVATVPRQIFMNLIKAQIDTDLKNKIEYINDYLPCKELSQQQKEQLAYSITTHYYQKGEAIVKQGRNYDSMYMVAKGQIIITRNQSELLYGNQGSIIAEECILLNQKSQYTVKVDSDRARIYKLKKVDMVQHFSEQIRRRLVNCFRMKVNCRKDLGLLAKSHRVRLGSGAGFHLASPSARRRLSIVKERSQKFLQKDKFLEINQNKYTSILEGLREVTEERLQDTLQFGSSKERLLKIYKTMTAQKSFTPSL